MIDNKHPIFAAKKELSDQIMSHSDAVGMGIGVDRNPPYIGIFISNKASLEQLKAPYGDSYQGFDLVWEVRDFPVAL